MAEYYPYLPANKRAKPCPGMAFLKRPAKSGFPPTGPIFLPVGYLSDPRFDVLPDVLVLTAVPKYFLKSSV
jgi:hypothetical protein